ncbi:MAG: hypothetical protein E6Q97_36785 [Desulfurellales bacterium]|nr:MAG: hypothetical protein E6Q97_36785 [Desulfurellales bacterium]
MSDPHIYTEAEIDLFLKGDRRDVDKLVLTSINAIAHAFITFRDLEFRPHVIEENQMKDALGDPADVERRRVWLDLQIKKEMDRAALRQKILEASLLRVIPIALLAVMAIFATGLHEHLSAWLSNAKTAMPVIKDLKK